MVRDETPKRQQHSEHSSSGSVVGSSSRDQRVRVWRICADSLLLCAPVAVCYPAPWCGHCKALEPKYETLGKSVLADPSLSGVTIAKMDATANDYDRAAWEVKGYPTIFFKPAGKKPQLYEGARDADDMLKYIKANGKTLKKGKKGKKGGKKKKQAKKVEVEEAEE